MIIVDVETGGIDPIKNPLLSIGAVDFESDEEFYVKIEPYQGLDVTEEALNINKIDLKTWNGYPLPDAMALFLKWLEKRDKILAGHNPGFDLGFLRVNFERCGMKSPFSYRTVDLHTLAYIKFNTSLSSSEIYETIGMEQEPTPHNALDGAKWETKAFDFLISDIYKNENFVYEVEDLLKQYRSVK